MRTDKARFGFVSALACFTALLWLATACTSEAGRKKEDIACQIENERKIEQAIEEMKFMPTPVGLEYDNQDYQKNWKRYEAEFARVNPVWDKYYELFKRQPNA